MKQILVMFVLLLTMGSIKAQENTRWRGAQGNGIYAESGLLKQWPVDGPEILWSFEALGQGHSSAAVQGDALYTTGMIEEKGILFRFTLDGELVYKKEYGPEFIESFYGTRGTPVVVGDKLYLVSGQGKLYCINSATGDVNWEKDLFSDLDGKNIRWGFCETPVVDGELIYLTPGGKRYNVVALNRHSGEVVWSNPGVGDLSAYGTPLLFEHGGRKILAAHTENHLLGLDAASGKLLWKVDHTNKWFVHPNTPIYHEGSLFYFSGYGQGGGLVELNADGSAVKKKWFRTELDSRMGGAVLVDGYIYGSGDMAREWRCVDWETGKDVYTSSAIGKGVVIYADGMLYCYSDRGELAMVKADPSGFEVLGKTKVIMGSEQNWAHPVIHKGVLYLRHGKALIAYKVR